MNNHFSNVNIGNNYTPNYQEHGLLQTLLNSMEGEAAAVDFYTRLAELAPSEKNRDTILKIAEDERIHLQSFVNLYYSLTGKHPNYQVERVAFNTYEEGLNISFDDELKDYETYRNQYLKTRNQTIRDVFFRALTDEIKHATIFNNLKASIVISNPTNKIAIKDYGPESFVVNIDEVTKRNDTFRTALWTGEHLQVTLMSIGVGGEIGLEIHPTLDQFLRIEEGEGIVQMGDQKEKLNFEERVADDFAIMIPAGKWHNVRNTGANPLKIYSIYAPPQHPHGTVHRTKAEAIAAEGRELE